MLFEVRDLTVDYGKARALDSVSLNIDKGEIVAVIGPNGAGKSTLLRTISGLVPPVSGIILFKGLQITKLSPAQIVRHRIAHSQERGKVFPEMTVLENLKMGAYVRKEDITFDLNYVFSLFVVLKNRQSQVAGSLSGGEQTMLSIGRALMLKPDLLLVDEPTLGLAPMICMELGDKLSEISHQRTSILLVEQNARLAFSIGDRCYVIENGRVVIEGKTTEIKENSHVREAYLGL